MNSKFTKLEIIIFILFFSLLAVFLIHNFDSIGQDIGRHLKTGEIIWQAKEVPKTNLFSFTEPDFPFTNHHWLSEVIFYGIYGWFGFTGLILLKVVFVLAAFLLLFFVAKKYATFWPIVISFLFSIFIFIERTEVRPEIFSFVILAFFLWVLFGEKYRGSTLNLQKGRTSNLLQGRTFDWLWFLPIAQLLWVNLHIYFFIGPVLVLSFLIDQLINLKNKQVNRSLSQFDGEESGARKRPIHLFVDLSIRRTLTVLCLVFIVTIFNPNGIQGALLPFNILKEYVFSIVENQTLAFLANFFGFKLTIFVFKLSVAAAVILSVINFRKTRQRIFEILILIFSIYAGFKMLRNLPLYALVSFPILAILLSDVSQSTKTKLVTYDVTRRISRVFKIAVAVFLFFMIFWVSGGGYYKAIRSAKVFGFSVSGEVEKAVKIIN